MSEKFQEDVKKQEINRYHGYQKKEMLLPTNHIDDLVNLNSKGEKMSSYEYSYNQCSLSFIVDAFKFSLFGINCS